MRFALDSRNIGLTQTIKALGCRSWGLAVLKNLQRLIEEKKDAGRNKQRLDQIRQTFIGYLDPVTLVSRAKLVLNRNNDTYFQTYTIFSPCSIRTVSMSTK